MAAADQFESKIAPLERSADRAFEFGAASNPR